MAVCIYSDGKWQSLAGKKISKDGEWKSLGDFDKMKIGNSWHKLGFAETDTVDVPPVMQFRNGEEPPTGNKWYVTPNGSGDLSGSSWENAASTDTLRLVVINAVSGDSIYFSEGIYDFTAMIDNPAGVNLYGGFALDNLSWDNRNGFIHQTRITSNGFGTAAFVDGFFLLNQSKCSNFFKNCIVCDCQVTFNYTLNGSKTENCLFRRCTCTNFDPPNNSTDSQPHVYEIGIDCFFSECQFNYYFAYASGKRDSGYSSYYTYAVYRNCQFYKCYFSKICFGNFADSVSKITTTPDLNCVFVQCELVSYDINPNIAFNSHVFWITGCVFVDCNFKDKVSLKKSTVINSSANRIGTRDSCCVINSDPSFIDELSYTTIVNFNYGDSQSLSTTAANSVSWNSNVVLNNYSVPNASSGYSDYGIVLGDDNLLSKFTATGYYPARGVQSLGGCPCPFDDPDGYAAYVASFGDWHPSPDSVLVGKGTYISSNSTDLDGVTRPDPPTIGAYEPRPQETEQ